MDIENGGASWIKDTISLVDTEYKSDRFNKINTGIY